MATKYYKKCLEVGYEFQDFIIDLLLKEVGMALSNYSSKKYQYDFGENKQGIEIKLDTRCTETGRLSIEIAEKSKAENSFFVQSGIYRNDNSWMYIQGNYDVVYIFTVKMLRGLHRSRKFEVHELPTIRKFYLPFDKADKYCAKKIVLNGGVS